MAGTLPGSGKRPSHLGDDGVKSEQMASGRLAAIRLITSFMNLMASSPHLVLTVSSRQVLNF